MAVATEAPDVKDVNDDFVRNWPMPKVFSGQDVIWFAGGQQNSSTHMRCYVTRVYDRGVELGAHGGGHAPMGMVRHVGDPYLIVKPNCRKNDGAWDFLQVDMHREAVINNLAIKLELLIEKVNGLCATSPLGTEDMEIEGLRAMIVGAGREVDQRWSLNSLKKKARELNLIE